MISDTGHLFMYLLAFHISFLRKYLFMSFAFFSNSVIFLLFSLMSSLYILDISPLSDIWLANIFSPFYRLSFHFVDGLFCFVVAF